ncbi:MAG TPA: hypothetical protein VFA64_11705 [Hyphomicrobiaceae bacterium]|nr:hypothetical protein [Hyphomicrobiaceae bacterium]
MKHIASTLLALAVLGGIAAQTALAADPSAPAKQFYEQLQREGY